MSVHYKFKAQLNYSTITFDGIHISVGDLKKAIIDQKRLAKSADSDLQITNAQTKEVYETEDTLIPKNTSVIVARVPLSGDKRSKQGHGGNNGPPGSNIGGIQQRNYRNLPLPPSAVAKGVDLATMEGTEEEKIQAMMSQSTADYDPSNFMRIRGQNQFGRVPPSYTCYRCQKPGHWIKDCPMGPYKHDEPRVPKSTGIPRSFMVVVDGPRVPGALITPEGRYAVPAVEHAAHQEQANKTLVPVDPPPTQKPKIPEDLLCCLCQDLLTDALLVPCCANSYCDDCIRTALLESEQNECPGCHEKDVSPNSLIPNRFLRTTANNFKNETGYAKPQKPIEPPQRVVTLKDDNPEETDPSKEGNSLLDDLSHDLFPNSPRKVDGSQDSKDEMEADDKADIYDFNDGSIPSPFAAADPDANKSNSQGPPPLLAFRGHGRTPLQSGLPLPPGLMTQNFKSGLEPPPPGFEDTPPPGEGPLKPLPELHNRQDGERPPHFMQQQQQGHFPPHGMGPSMHHRPPMMHPHMQQMGGPPPFNPNQPPPFHPGMGPPPGMYPGGPGPMQQNYGMPQYRGPHGPPPMYQGRPYHGDRYMNDRPAPYRSRYNPRDRPPDSFRERERERREPIVAVGAIEDPLKEFEKLMREKDLRKELANKESNPPPPVKRSGSPSPPPGSPARRTPPSPFLKRPSRSPFSRSPSPKRMRNGSREGRREPFPPRRSTSRSRHSPPPMYARRVVRSRSRSRNRSITPQYAISVPSKRRSPRRAPPHSPSPQRFPPRKHDKPDPYELRHRYESSRYGPGRDRERERDRERDRDRDRERDRDRREYDKKYETSKYPPPVSAPSKYESRDGRYESNSRSRYEPPRQEPRHLEPLIPPEKFEHKPSEDIKDTHKPPPLIPEAQVKQEHERSSKEKDKDKDRSDKKLKKEKKHKRKSRDDDDERPKTRSRSKEKVQAVEKPVGQRSSQPRPDNWQPPTENKERKPNPAEIFPRSHTPPPLGPKKHETSPPRTTLIKQENKNGHKEKDSSNKVEDPSKKSKKDKKHKRKSVDSDSGSKTRSRSKDRDAKPEDKIPTIKELLKGSKDDLWPLPEKLMPTVATAAEVFNRASNSPNSTSNSNQQPVPLAVRKQKRINIKLTSSKAAEESSSSSSSDEDEPSSSTLLVKPPRTSEETDDEKKKKKKEKRKKRRRSNSSSSGDEKSKKKSKKDKKKKKKSKKKKAKDKP